MNSGPQPVCVAPLPLSLRSNSFSFCAFPALVYPEGRSAKTSAVVSLFPARKALCPRLCITLFTLSSLLATLTKKHPGWVPRVCTCKLWEEKSRPQKIPILERGFQKPHHRSAASSRLLPAVNCLPAAASAQEGRLPTIHHEPPLTGRWSRVAGRCTSVQKVPHARKHHGETQPVGGGDHIPIPDRSARLYDGGCSGRGQRLHPVGKREERIRSHHASLQRRLRLHHRNLDRVHAAHLPGAYAERRAILRKHDGVGLHVLGNFPGEPHRGHFVRRSRALCDRLQFAFVDFAQIRLLHQHP